MARKEKVDKSKGVEFVSTNDIVTAELAVALKPRVLEMAVNLRPFLTELDSNDAGMYAAGFYLMSPDDYSTPEAIRLAMTGGRLRCVVLPRKPTNFGSVLSLTQHHICTALRRAGHMVSGSNKESTIPGCCSLCCVSKMSIISNWGSG